MINCVGEKVLDVVMDVWVKKERDTCLLSLVYVLKLSGSVDTDHVCVFSLTVLVCKYTLQAFQHWDIE